MDDQLLYLSEAGVLHVGTGYVSNYHQHATPVLALGLQGPFRVWGTPGAPAAECRGVIVPPGQPHRADTSGQRSAALYFEPDGPLWCQLRNALPRSRHARVGGLVLLDAAEVADLLASVCWIDITTAGTDDFDDCLAAWRRRLSPAPQQALDERVLQTAQWLRAVSGEPALTERLLAQHCALSGSRLRHLFSQHAGVPLRRYRVWSRLRRALESLGRGKGTTEAAMEAGFADCSHLHRVFRGMLGVRPSAIFGDGRPLPRVLSSRREPGLLPLRPDG